MSVDAQGNWQFTYTAPAGGSTLTIQRIYLVSGETVSIDWGDGSANTDITTNTLDLDHPYAEGAYTVTLLGTAHLTQLYLYNQPEVSGDVADWGPYLPTSLERLYLDRNNFYGDLSGWGPYLPSLLVDLRLYSNNFYGDLSGWGQYLPSGLERLLLDRNNFSGDLSGWGQYLPTSLLYLYLWVNSFTKYSQFLITAARTATTPSGVIWGLPSREADDYEYHLGVPADARQYLIDALGWEIYDKGALTRHFDVPVMVHGGRMMRVRPRSGNEVTFDVEGANGTLKAEINTNEITSGLRLFQADDVVFTATPDAGYQVKEWRENSEIVGDTSNTYTSTAVSDDIHVTVEFEVAPWEPDLDEHETASFTLTDIGWAEVTFIDEEPLDAETASFTLTDIIWEAFEPDVTFDPDGGEFIVPTEVTLNTDGDLSYYTTDLTEPTLESESVAPGGTVLVDTFPTTIKAKSWVDGIGLSEITYEAVFTEEDHESKEDAETASFTLTDIGWQEITVIDEEPLDAETASFTLTDIGWQEIDPEDL